MRIEKIPVTVVTGFLGAGKTTLIRRLMERPEGRRLAIIVNEFGDVGVDGDILKGCAVPDCPEDAIVELANGCLCCTVADEFVPTMEALLDRATPPDHILIETSGLALPKPLLKAFDWPSIRTRVTVDAVVAVADAEAVAAGRFAPDPARVADQRAADGAVDHDTPLGEVFEDQIACADVVVLNKADLVDAAALARARATILAEAPRAVPVVAATEGEVDRRVLLGLGAAAEDDLAARPSHHDGEDDHDHDDFDSFAAPTPEFASAEAAAAAVEAVCRAHGLLRVKGRVPVAGKPLGLLVQAVGPRVRAQFDRPWGAAPRTGALVVIAETGVDRAAVAAALSAA
jgi:cobalamin biosynthesis protein CobW